MNIKKTQKIFSKLIYIINYIRRKWNFIFIKIGYILGIRKDYHIKLHLGCGEVKKDGFIDVDLRKTEATDIVCDIRKLPYPDNSALTIENYHVIEHLPRHEICNVLKEWHRILRPGGRLIIECPDFDKLVTKYLDGDEKQLDGIFGLQRFESDFHLFGYNIDRLTKLLCESGFVEVRQKLPLDYHSKEWDCIRVECKK